MKEIKMIFEKSDPIHSEIQSDGMKRSFSAEPPIAPGRLREFAAELMVAISNGCFGRGAKEIGHIKAHFEYRTGFLNSDTLGSPDDVTVEGKDGAPAGEFTATINSVVFGLAKETIRTATEEALKSVSSRYGLHEIKAHEKGQKR